MTPEPFNHCRQQRPVKTHGWDQIEVEFLLPLVIIENRESAGRRGRAADNVDDDVNATKTPANSSATIAQPSAVGDVCGDEHRIGRIVVERSRRGQDFDTGISASAPRPLLPHPWSAGDEGAAALELAFIGSWADLQRDDLVPVDFEDVIQVDRAAGEIAGDLNGDDDLPVPFDIASGSTE